MKKNLAIYATAMSWLAVLAIPQCVAAQNNTTQQNKKKHHTYKVVDLGTLGGPGSAVSGLEHTLTAQGAVAGGADTPDANPNPACLSPIFFGQDCSVQHAFRWQNGVHTDLGALPGAINSFPFGINESGWVIGASETGVTDPVLGAPEFVAVLWRNGQIKNLGTLGGNESLATDVNNRGRIVGFSANSVPDPVSMFGFATQTRPFIWEHGVMRDLGTLAGPDGAAFLMNERGQVIGQYFLNAAPNAKTGIPTQDPILWEEDGTAVDLGTLGGTVGTAVWINNRGQVVGQSSLPTNPGGCNPFGPGGSGCHAFFWDKGVMTDLGTLGGDNSTPYSVNDAGEVVGRGDVPGSQSHHGFLWKGGVMTDLGTPHGDLCSTAASVNSEGQIVGDAGACFVGGRAWLWENGGPLVDLNTLAIPGSGLHLADAALINDRGEIICAGVLPNGDRHAVMLVPQGDCDDACEAGIADSEIIPAAIPVRAMMSGLKTKQNARFAHWNHIPNP